MKRSAKWLTWTRPLSCMPMSTKQPKSTTLSTVPVNSMPAARSSSLSTPCLKTGGGQVLAGIAPGTGQLGEDVLQRQRADLQLLGHGVEVDRGDLLGSASGASGAAASLSARSAGAAPSRSSTRAATA